MADKVLKGKALLAKLRSDPKVRDSQALLAWIGRFKKARKSGKSVSDAKLAAKGKKLASKSDDLASRRKTSERKPEHYLRWEPSDTAKNLDDGRVHVVPDDYERARMVQKGVVLWLRDNPDGSVSVDAEGGPYAIRREKSKFHISSPKSSFTVDRKQFEPWFANKLRGKRFTVRKGS